MQRPGRLQRSGSKRGLDPTGCGDDDDHAPKRPRVPTLARLSSPALILAHRTLWIMLCVLSLCPELLCPSVTFWDLDAAMRACVDPVPAIDGRRANCNLASLGVQRSKPPTPQHVEFLKMIGAFEEMRTLLISERCCHINFKEDYERL